MANVELAVELAGLVTRRLAPQDLGAVADIDASITGRSRRPYVERRLQNALREPARHLQFAVDVNGKLAGYVLARRLEGEFGRSHPELRLEIIGVVPGLQGKGVGRALLARVEAEAAKQGIGQLRTQASWRDHVMMRFLDRAGFQLGHTHVIDCEVHTGRNVGRPVQAEAPGSGEVNYGEPRANDFEPLARDNIEVRSLVMDDVAGAVRVDSRITGEDRSAYIEHQVKEALTDTAVRVSLAACRDGSVAGYVTARVDLGDFGRTEPVAIIDTIAVDPWFAGNGIGTALVSQLAVNLEALRVERVETVLERERLDMLAFFQKMGFVPSQRLGFVKRMKA